VLYVDVTSSCKSPMNTGVQRMVRGMVAALARRTGVTPLLWSPRLNSYCRLATPELRFLTQPFAHHPLASAKPEQLSARFPWSKTARHLRHRKRRLALETATTGDDVLLVPEIFQDNRLARFGAAKTWFAGRRYAVFHDAIALRLPEFTAPERQRHFPDYIRALAGFDTVLCVSREVEADLRFFWNSHGVVGTATAVLGWPTDFGQPRPVPQSNFRARRILCVATLERRKNHLALLAASEKLWSAGLSFELALIGRTTADWGGTVLCAVDRLVRRGRPVKWLRHVSDHALHQAYRDCSFSVYPSLREGFGLPILESLWHGRPCVCGNDGAIAEAAGGGGCLMITCADTDSLAGGLRELLTNEATYRRLFDEARDRTFRSWDHYTNDLFREIGAA
jgi:glycosyltransferase involved in cell wall biosynthesis